MNNELQQLITWLKSARYATAFTGAGVSVESGIAPFTGAGGLWNQYDPKFIEINFFLSDPKHSWQEMKKIFFTDMDEALPNPAHRVLAKLEQKGLLKGIITQNIDGLHQRAGSQNVQEFHGTIHTLSCLHCGRKYRLEDINLEEVPPTCLCGGVLKPDFVFYGEGIPPRAYENSADMAAGTDLMIIVGTAGQVMPACSLPLAAKEHGAKIVEINPRPSAYSGHITDLYFPEPAGAFFTKLAQAMDL
ncbi:MAG: NAD-dependent deacylase [Elusimicrobiaceae bacterium]|nr:NAD-dependent deacylase [Elusimicrobiaceae bacterium]